jgi:hypothetical protein
MNEQEILHFFDHQLAVWPAAAARYDALQDVQTRTLIVDGQPYHLQHNPARITSSAAAVDAQSIRERPCFLCAANRPPEQESLPFKDRYSLLVNPFPIFPRHLTIPAIDHLPQRIYPRFADMLDLAQLLPSFVIFYNGPQCGASAPDHFHFQAGSKGLLPIETHPAWHTSLHATSADRATLLTTFETIYNRLPPSPDGPEPLLNLLIWHDGSEWTMHLFPRRRHRPACYTATGDAQYLISPASVDMGGLVILPVVRDYERLMADTLAEVLREVCLADYLPQNS